MKVSIQKIAQLINASIDDVNTETEVCICGLNCFEDAGRGEISFASDPGFLNQISTCSASALIVPDSLRTNFKHQEGPVLLFSKDPKRAFFNLVAHFFPAAEIQPGIHTKAVIGDDVQIGKKVLIGPGAVIGDRVCLGDKVHIMANTVVESDSVIGNNTVLKPNVTIMERTEIGAHVLIHPGTVIGSDGYGFTQESDKHEKIVHTGVVQIGDHAEIGSCNTIDRGTIGRTIIGNGVKTDNQVHIAHNVRIGDNCLIVAQVAIAGSTHLGKNVIVAGKAGISGHLKIGDNTIIGPYAGVHSNVGPNEIVSGIPHMPHERWRKVVNIVSRLPEIRKKLFSFEKRLKKLEKDI